MNKQQESVLKSLPFKLKANADFEEIKAYLERKKKQFKLFVIAGMVLSVMQLSLLLNVLLRDYDPDTFNTFRYIMMVVQVMVFPVLTMALYFQGKRMTLSDEEIIDEIEKLKK